MMKATPSPALFRRPTLSGVPSGPPELASRARISCNFSAILRRRRRFARDVAAVESLGFRLVEFDFEPFAEVARLLYEGPWVAERYAATKPLIETHPEALHPVTRAIIEGARKFDAVATFEALLQARRPQAAR